MNFTYIVECRDGTLYTGWTNDLERRIREHNGERGAKYTRNRGPVKLVFYESFETKEEAMKREYAIKKMSRQHKLRLILDELKNEYVHKNEVTDAAAHDEQVEDFVAAEVLVQVVEDRKL